MPLSAKLFRLILQPFLSFPRGKKDRLPLLVLRVEHRVFQINLSSAGYNCPDGFTIPFPQETLQVLVSGVPSRVWIVSEDSSPSENGVG